jgi:hypothetical protein
VAAIDLLLTMEVPAGDFPGRPPRSESSEPRVAPAALGYLGVVAAAFSLLAGASLAREGAFSVHEGIGFLSIIVFLLWLLATSIALVVRGQRI